MKHRSQPFSSRLQGCNKSLVWCESLPIHLVYLCTTCYISGIPRWALRCSTLNIEEENPRSGSAVGAVMESWPSLKLLSLVVPGGKWLPFSQVGGIPMSEREPHWWHINRVPNNVTRMQLTQTKWFVLFLARAFVPKLNDWIWSFSSQPLISYPWLPNQAT